MICGPTRPLSGAGHLEMESASLQSNVYYGSLTN